MEKYETRKYWYSHIKSHENKKKHELYHKIGIRIFL